MPFNVQISLHLVETKTKSYLAAAFGAECEGHNLAPSFFLFAWTRI